MGPTSSRPANPPTPIDEITVAAVISSMPRSIANWLLCTKGTNTTTKVSAYMPRMSQYVRVREAALAVRPSVLLISVWSRGVGGLFLPSGNWPIDSGSLRNQTELSNIAAPPVSANEASAVRQPYAFTSVAATGGAIMLAMLVPEVAIASAVPLRSTNQRTTVALHGTHDALIPNGATTPRPRKAIHRLGAVAQMMYPAVSSTAPTATTRRGPMRSVSAPVTADNEL